MWIDYSESLTKVIFLVKNSYQIYFDYNRFDYKNGK